MRLPRALITFLIADLTWGWNHATEVGFRKALRSNDYTLVAFVFPTQQVNPNPILQSRHLTTNRREASKALEQEWISIQETERDNNVLSVDCAAKPKLCAEFDTASYPAIRLFRHRGDNDTMERYRGPRMARSIISYLRRALRPAVSILDSKNITSFLSIDDVVFVAHLGSGPGDASLHQRFGAVARKYRDRYSFAVTRSSSSNDKTQRSQAGIACYSNVDDMQHTTAELEAIEAIEDFVKMCAAPLVPELTRRNELLYLGSGRSIVRYFTKTNAEREAFVKEMRPLARKYAEYLLFGTIDTNEYPDTTLLFGHQAGLAGVLSVHNPRNGDIFPYVGGKDISADVIEAFLVDIINGKVKPWPGQLAGERSPGVKHEEL